MEKSAARSFVIDTGQIYADDLRKSWHSRFHHLSRIRWRFAIGLDLLGISNLLLHHIYGREARGREIRYRYWVDFL